MQTKAFFNFISMLTTDTIGGADQRYNPYNTQNQKDSRDRARRIQDCN